MVRFLAKRALGQFFCTTRRGGSSRLGIYSFKQGGSHGNQRFLDSYRDFCVARTHSLYHPLDARPPRPRNHRSRVRLDHLGQDHRAREDHRLEDWTCRARRRASRVRTPHLTEQEQIPQGHRRKSVAFFFISKKQF